MAAERPPESTTMNPSRFYFMRSLPIWFGWACRMRAHDEQAVKLEQERKSPSHNLCYRIFWFSLLHVILQGLTAKRMIPPELVPFLPESERLKSLTRYRFEALSVHESAEEWTTMMADLEFVDWARRLHEALRPYMERLETRRQLLDRMTSQEWAFLTYTMLLDALIPRPQGLEQDNDYQEGKKVSQRFGLVETGLISIDVLRENSETRQEYEADLQHLDPRLGAQYLHYVDDVKGQGNRRN